MFKYRVIWEEGNGYKCSCCREEIIHEEEFSSLEEAREFVTRIEARKRNPNNHSVLRDVDVVEVIYYRPVELEPEPQLLQELLNQVETSNQGAGKK